MSYVEESLLPRVYAELVRFKTADAGLIDEVARACSRDPEEERRQAEATAQADADRALLGPAVLGDGDPVVTGK